MSPIALSLKPFNRFIKNESSPSILLLVVTVATLLAVNLGLHESYVHLLHEEFVIGYSKFTLSKSLHHWINDGLMALFFFSVGLAIKREISIGELSTIRKASLPVFAALGGMVFPVIFFLLLNNTAETQDGWAIPMATDIAFTIGIMNLLGKRVPHALKVFITAFAVVDDLGAILVIAIYYSTSIQMHLILSAISLFLLLLILTRFGLYNKYFYTVVSIAIWLLLLRSGIHATIAGVLVAFAIPIRKKRKISRFPKHIQKAVDQFKSLKGKIPSRYILTEHEMKAIKRIDRLTEQVQTPLQKAENKLEGWVAFAIMPLFAFANAGVKIDAESFIQIDFSMIIAASLLFGKLIGISLFCYLAIKMKLASLPENASFKQLSITSLLGGVGFTMSLFIANLAFEYNHFIDASKIGILLGSILAGTIGYFLLKSTLTRESDSPG
ncbi:Na+/H+ antiporter NhaA [Mangrovibacterium marinum]|uniref:Na(+)/H(+) antiporter NhaA n=1 Tax=Mangrovibacterium marinum TaxID=1639118 RepID=A0A2T5C5S0_9BACT|nr:Na+/H+ antiporter NhaA [Mangrovibacterium marinum]PTN10264.1 sodium/proton antiporter (NhaA family) [Mangrovibacterium marinum]